MAEEESEDTLLKVHRTLTDEEVTAWVKQDFFKMQRRNRILEKDNEALRKRVEYLEKKTKGKPGYVKKDEFEDLLRRYNEALDKYWGLIRGTAKPVLTGEEKL